MKESYGSSRLLAGDIARRTEQMLGVTSFPDLWLQRENLALEEGAEERGGVPYKTSTYAAYEVEHRPSITLYKVDTAKLWGRDVPREYMVVAHRLAGSINGEEVILEAAGYRLAQRTYMDHAEAHDLLDFRQLLSRAETSIKRDGRIHTLSQLSREELKRISRFFKVR